MSSGSAVRAVCLSVTLLLSSAAEGRSVTSAAVALDRRQEAEAAQVAWSVRTFLQNDPRADYLDLAARAEGEGPTLRMQKVEQAKLALAKGLNSFDEMDVPAALGHLDEAQKLLEATDLAVSMPVLLDVLAARGLALFAKGDRAEASNTFALLFTLRSYEVDPKRLTPEASAVLEESKARVATVAPTLIEVQSQPAAAWIFVDGVYRGVSPLEAKGFAPGVHYVTAVAPGYEFAQQRSLVGPGLITKLPLNPSPTGQTVLAQLRQVQAGMLSGAGADAVAALARWAKTEEALVVGVRRQDASLVLTGLRVAGDGQVLARAERSVGAKVVPSDVEDFTRALLATDLPRAVAGAVPAGPVPGAPVVVPAAALAAKAPAPPNLAGAGKRGMGIALLSIGGIVATAGGVVGGLAEITAKDARGVAQVDLQRKAQLTSRTRDLALAADLCYTGAALSAAAGITLIVLGALEAKNPEPAKAENAKPIQLDKVQEPDRLDDGTAPKEQPEKPKEKEKLKPKERDPFGDDEPSVGFAPTPGGAAIFVRGVF
ncbi:MAG TPA: PEGA domain-containing protein [Myxococcales bacterium]|jgi:hypothetical protein